MSHSTSITWIQKLNRYMFMPHKHSRKPPPTCYTYHDLVLFFIFSTFDHTYSPFCILSYSGDKRLLAISAKPFVSVALASFFFFQFHLFLTRPHVWSFHVHMHVRAQNVWAFIIRALQSCHQASSAIFPVCCRNHKY